MQLRSWRSDPRQLAFIFPPFLCDVPFFNKTTELPAVLRLSPNLPLTDKIERVVARLARARLAMPNNPTLGEMVGTCRQSAAKALIRLVRSGKILVERRGNERRACVGQTCTGWGEALPGHAPYCTTPKGLPRPPRNVRADPLPPGTEQWTPPTITERHIVPTAASKTCEWPMWADGERPNGKHCGAPATKRSYCADHQI